jgi:general stress protein YciG
MAEKSRRGFAVMDRDRQRQIASMGGRAAHRKGTAHKFTPEEAREAGRKGGQAAHERGRAHVFTSEQAREAGRKGGQHSHAARTTAGEVSAAIPDVPAEQVVPAIEPLPAINGGYQPPPALGDMEENAQASGFRPTEHVIQGQ